MTAIAVLEGAELRAELLGDLVEENALLLAFVGALRGLFLEERARVKNQRGKLIQLAALVFRFSRA